MKSTSGTLADIKRAHFIGIGGIGMSALARLFLHERILVSGSDRAPSAITEALVHEGATLFSEQSSRNITGDIDIVVYTEAMPHDHEELVAARERGILLMNYFEALGMVANEYYLIAVAGSHGKTTTTSMLIDIFEDAGLDPTAIVGSLRSRTGSNFRAGKSKYFIVEACEYKRNFLSLSPDVLVITNIEYEHVDYYSDLSEVQAAFREFAEKISEDGAIIANVMDPSIAPVIAGLQCKVIDYRANFDPLRQLSVPGIHNQMNAAAAAAVAQYHGVDDVSIEHSLIEFKNSWRRFEYKGEIHGAKVYDDYGHHPTEVRATIDGARELHPDKHLTLVFQPHTYSRAHELFDDFVAALTKADRVLLAPIYAAREIDTKSVSSEKLAAKIRDAGGSAEGYTSLDSITKTLTSTLTSDDVVLVMGAGDITKVADELTK
jgi:UDP-N-acetylmuramate--alanine ligase